jgi:hypothetical protein
MRLPVPTPRRDDVLHAFRRVDRAAVVVAEVVVRVLGRQLTAPRAGRAPTHATSFARDERARRPLAAEHETLVYELLDAHADTADLAAELVSEPLWAAHLDYLRALQRSGRQALAQMVVEGQP